MVIAYKTTILFLLSLELFLYPSSILSACLNHCNLCSLRNSYTFSMPFVSQIVSLFGPSFSIFHKSYVIISFQQFTTFFDILSLKTKHLTPQHKTLLTQLSLKLPLILSNTTLLHSKLALSLISIQIVFLL